MSAPISPGLLLGVLVVFGFVSVYLFIVSVTVLVAGGGLGAEYPETKKSADWIGALGILFSLAGVGMVAFAGNQLRLAKPVSA